MSSHERLSTEEGGYGTIRLLVPEKMDESWCAMFTEAYGHEGLRFMVHSDSYVRDVAYGGRRPRHMRKKICGDAAMFDGEFHGLRMFPIDLWEEYDAYSEKYQIRSEKVPHAILTQAINLDDGTPFYRSEQERILVPLSGYVPGETLLLYYH